MAGWHGTDSSPCSPKAQTQETEIRPGRGLLRVAELGLNPQVISNEGRKFVDTSIRYESAIGVCIAGDQKGNVAFRLALKKQDSSLRRSAELPARPNLAVQPLMESWWGLKQPSIGD